MEREVLSVMRVVGNEAVFVEVELRLLAMPKESWGE